LGQPLNTHVYLSSNGPGHRVHKIRSFNWFYLVEGPARMAEESIFPLNIMLVGTLQGGA